jgi:hypothetical protein
MSFCVQPNHHARNRLHTFRLAPISNCVWFFGDPLVNNKTSSSLKVWLLWNGCSCVERVDAEFQSRDCLIDKVRCITPTMIPSIRRHVWESTFSVCSKLSYSKATQLDHPKQCKTKFPKESKWCMTDSYWAGVVKPYTMTQHSSKLFTSCGTDSAVFPPNVVNVVVS